MSNSITFSIVIGTRNRDNNLKICIQSLLSQRYNKSKYEIIIVDYGGTTDTAGMVKKFHRSNLRYYHIDIIGRYNESRAKNIGIKKSKFEYILCTNSDIIFPELSLSKINKILIKQEKEYLYCSRKIEIPENYRLVENLPSIIRNDKEFQILNAKLGSITATGDFQLAKRNFWLKLKGYDERMISYGAMDIDMVERFEKEGIKQFWLSNHDIDIYHQYHIENKGQPLETTNINVLFKKYCSPYSPLQHQWGNMRFAPRILTIQSSSNVFSKFCIEEQIEHYDGLIIKDNNYDISAKHRKKLNNMLEIADITILFKPKYIRIFNIKLHTKNVCVGTLYNTRTAYLINNMLVLKRAITLRQIYDFSKQLSLTLNKIYLQ